MKRSGWKPSILVLSGVGMLLGCAADPSLTLEPDDPSDVRRHSSSVGHLTGDQHSSASAVKLAPAHQRTTATTVPAAVSGTAVSGTPVSGTPVSGTPVSGTPVSVTAMAGKLNDGTLVIVKPSEPALPPGVVRVADAAGQTRLDGAGLVKEMLERWPRVKDYTADLEKQEFLHGRVEPAHQIAERTRVTPKALHYRWVGEVNRGRHALWATDKNDSKMGVYPHPFLPVGAMWLDPGGFMARTQSQYDFRDGGMQGILATLPKSLRPGATTWTYTGTGSVGDRSTWILMGADDTNVPGEHNQMELHIDQTELLPLFFCGRNREGRLNIRVVYRNVKLNVGLVDDDFEPSKIWK